MYGTYRNKHNNREMTIDRMEISDDGTEFWYAGEYDMFLTRNLEQHWVKVSELGTPKPAMTDMEILKLSLMGVREDYASMIEDPMRTNTDRDIERGWVEAMDFVVAQIGYIQDGSFQPLFTDHRLNLLKESE